MQSFLRVHKKAKLTLVVLCCAVLGTVIFLSFFNWNLARPALARMIAAKTGRPTSINGDLKVHLFSWEPSAEIDGLVVKNPPWADRDVMFGAARITINVSLGRLLMGQLLIPKIELFEPIVNLERDSKGRASWELGTQAGTPNGNRKPAQIPPIRSLLIQNGKLNVVDQIRKLRFGGSLIASDESDKQDASAFAIRAKGSLNEKPFSLKLDGGPLLNLTARTPYSFSAHATAADINLETHVTVPRPFDLSALDVELTVSGNDLADIYYLTGLALPNTPHYRLAASIQVVGTTYRIKDLQGQIGSSDLTGAVVVETANARPKLTARLTSKLLNIVDLAPILGHPASDADSSASAQSVNGIAASQSAKSIKMAHAAQGPTTAAAGTEQWLLPDADLQVNRVRGMDADVSYQAAAVTAPKVPMRAVNFQLVLNNGLLILDPLSFVLDRGRFAGSVRIDARTNVPKSAIDMRMNDVDLSQFKTHALKDPPLSGILVGRLKVEGSGSSIHKFASTADGVVGAVIAHGEINDALAELTGINVTRGLGLLLARNESKTSIRCSVIDFHAQDGSLGARTMFVDTTDVLIEGRGDINFKDEALDFSIQGDPKKLRLMRVRSPITIKGTLLHPAIGVDVRKLAGQAVVATALGTLLTPVAAILAFVDPGLAKNKDCAASLSRADEYRQN